jgi:hypothetical protein
MGHASPPPMEIAAKPRKTILLLLLAPSLALSVWVRPTDAWARGLLPVGTQRVKIGWGRTRYVAPQGQGQVLLDRKGATISSRYDSLKPGVGKRYFVGTIAGRHVIVNSRTGLEGNSGQRYDRLVPARLRYEDGDGFFAETDHVIAARTGDTWHALNRKDGRELPKPTHVQAASTFAPRPSPSGPAAPRFMRISAAHTRRLFVPDTELASPRGDRKGRRR